MRVVAVGWGLKTTKDTIFVMYLDQLLGAARTRKLVKLLFSDVFNCFCSFLFKPFSVSYFRREIIEKGLKRTKKRLKCLKKVVQSAFGCAQHLKAGRHTQHIFVVFKLFTLLSLTYDSTGLCLNIFHSIIIPNS